MKQEDLDKSKLKPEHRMVLDWLCRNPARIVGFDEVAEALNVKRGIVERAFTALKHQRYGSLLPLEGPHGDVLRPRHAWLPPDAPVRALFPKIEHPTEHSKPARVERAHRPTVVRAAVAADAKSARLATLQAKKEAKRKFRMVVAAENEGRRADRISARAAAKQKVLDAHAKIAEKTTKAPPGVMKPAPKDKLANA